MPSPSEHYAKAEALMQRVSDMDPGLPIARNLIMMAHVYALLAAYTPPDPYRDYLFRDGYSMRNNTRIARAKEEFL